MRQSGGEVVRQLDNEHVLVRMEAAAACPRCAEGKGCGMGLVSGGREPLEVEAVVDPAEGSFRPGERVELECPPGDVLRLSAWAYGLPLLLALFGSLGGLRFGDAGTAIGALAGLAAGFLLARRHFRAAGRQLMPEARRS